MMIRLIVLSLLCVPTGAFVAPSSITPRGVAIQPRSNSAAPRPSLVTALDDAFESSVQPGLVSRLIRVGNHVPAFISLSYFGLVSMSSMMPGSMTVQPTLTSVLTKNVGPTTNRMFADFFPTLVTPPSFVFLVWPAIAVAQIATLIYSALQPIKEDAVLSQDNLTALALANLCATWWLTTASSTLPNALTLGSFLILPLVPLLSGFPLRKGKRNDALKFCPKSALFQLFSSFTTIASFLALAVELQHGGRLPFAVPAEVAASVFLGLYYTVVSMRNRSTVKRVVHAGAISGIAVKRIQEGLVGGAAGVGKLFLSVSFLGTLFVANKALATLRKED